MERHSFAMEIKKGKKNEYRQILGEIWPDLTAFLDQEKVHNFSIWNCLGMFQQPEAVKKQWTECFPDSEKALHCVRCGKCETVCPQKLPIRASLARLQEELDAL